MIPVWPTEWHHDIHWTGTNFDYQLWYFINVIDAGDQISVDDIHFKVFGKMDLT